MKSCQHISAIVAFITVMIRSYPINTCGTLSTPCAPGRVLGVGYTGDLDKQGPWSHEASVLVGETDKKTQGFQMVSAVKTTKWGECNREVGVGDSWFRDVSQRS